MLLMLINRPYLIALHQTTNIQIYDMTLKNSPTFHVHLQGCVNVHIRHMTVLAPEDSPNTDGFDIDCSVDVLLEDSYYSGGNILFETALS